MIMTRRWRIRRWGWHTEVLAERVEFTMAGGLIFWTGDQLILAVPPEQWAGLTELPRGGQ